MSKKEKDDGEYEQSGLPPDADENATTDLNTTAEPAMDEGVEVKGVVADKVDADTDADTGVEPFVAEKKVIEDSLDRVAELEQQVAELKNQYVRAHAETENIRKRAEIEVANGRKFAVEGFAKDLLNVRDSLGLASGVEISGEQGDAVMQMQEGLELTLRQLDGVLERFGVKPIDAEVGDKFDPELHQAMSTVDGGEVDSGCIVNVVQSGYKIQQRLLRAAMVVIAK